jgi:hypothetical protein
MTTERLLRKASQTLGAAAGTAVLTAALLAVPTPARAQYAISDSQLQTSVLSALHSDTRLAGANINASASQGVVTLTGTVPDQDELVDAEQTAAGVSGVRSIQDNMISSSGTQSPSPAQAQAQAQTNGMPPPPPADPGTAASGMPPAPPAEQSGQQSYTPYPNGNAQGAPPNQPNGYPNQDGYPNQPNGYPNQPNGYPNQANGYPPQYSQGSVVAPPPGPPRPLLAVSPKLQNNSGPVAIPPGTLLSVRTTQPLSTANLKDGDSFQVTSSSDIYVNGIVAIPRGAVLSGQVVESKNAGAFGGSPKLDLKLTSIQLGPNTYPVVSDVWSSEGPSKTGYTATNAAGGAIFGALIGAIAGGGVGAGVGAVAGGATGAAVSSATRGPRLTLPPEALLQFHIAQPLTVQPLRYDEAERIAASVPEQPVLHQRPPYAAPYPYPYPYAVRLYPY